MASVMSISSKMRFAHALAEDLLQFQILVLTRFLTRTGVHFAGKRFGGFNRSSQRSPDLRLRGESRHFMMIDQFGDALLRNLH
ncbi:hypothetical protein TSA1_30805 [Bradyrhizobium nitroreducens]|uniref:Uncharacterized protein n=1 Tax=Bradyrhizobium nitroreducens TaxID=709803 RepID=A0A2M6UJB4_9BRAD|nr:hypothetical protein TSA1_30805 [Bradyrhizobium nitroreducens]